MYEKLAEIAVKLFSLGGLVAVGLAIFELLKGVFQGLLEKLFAWITGRAEAVWTLVTDQADALSVDLAPGTELASLLAKANVLLPVDEGWRLLLLYLGVFSTVVGVKWMRNLIPGLK